MLKFCPIGRRWAHCACHKNKHLDIERNLDNKFHRLQLDTRNHVDTKSNWWQSQEIIIRISDFDAVHCILPNTFQSSQSHRHHDPKKGHCIYHQGLDSNMTMTRAFRHISTYFDIFDMCKLLNLFSWAGRVVTRAACPVQAPRIQRLICSWSPRRPQTAEAKVERQQKGTVRALRLWLHRVAISSNLSCVRGFIDEHGGYSTYYG